MMSCSTTLEVASAALGISMSSTVTWDGHVCHACFTVYMSCVLDARPLAFAIALDSCLGNSFLVGGAAFELAGCCLKGLLFCRTVLLALVKGACNEVASRPDLVEVCLDSLLVLSGCLEIILSLKQIFFGCSKLVLQVTQTLFILRLLLLQCCHAIFIRSLSLLFSRVRFGFLLNCLLENKLKH